MYCIIYKPNLNNLKTRKSLNRHKKYQFTEQTELSIINSTTEFQI